MTAPRPAVGGGPVRLGGRVVTDPIRTPWDDVGEADPAASSSYVHQQLQPSTVWVIDHNLGRAPSSWSLFDATGVQRSQFAVELPTVNRAVVRMDVPTAGTIRLI